MANPVQSSTAVTFDPKTPRVMTFKAMGLGLDHPYVFLKIRTGPVTKGHNHDL